MTKQNRVILSICFHGLVRGFSVNLQINFGKKIS